MAKYTISHACGHSREIQLYGKGSDRERKIGWLEGQDCPQCWAAAKRESEAKQPITATVSMYMGTDTDGRALVQIALTGGTINRKEDIKALGYRWGEVSGGVMGFLSISAPQKAWVLTISYTIVEDCLKKLSGIAEKIEMKISPLDIELMKKFESDRKEKELQVAIRAEEIKSIPVPEKPACYPCGRWNKKVYGNKKYGYRIYIDGKETHISDSDAVSLEKYAEDLLSYNEACKSVRV